LSSDQMRAALKSSYRYAPQQVSQQKIALTNCPETATLKSVVGSCIICADDAKRHVGLT